MLASAPIMLMSWIVALSTRSVIAFYAVRIIQGVALSIPYTVTPSYIAEIVEPKLRGQFGGYFQIFFYLGSLYTYATGPYLDYQVYIYVSCLPCVIFFICYILLPESPYYLLMVGKEDKALEALKWFRAGEVVEEEFALIKESIEEDMKNKGGWKDLIATKKDRYALVIVEIVCLIRYMNGMSTIVIYVTQTLSESGELALTSDQLAIMLAVLLLVTTFGASFIADKVGRKPLLIVSTVGGTLFNSIIAVYYYLDRNTDVDVSPYMWISYVSLLSFCIINNLGLGPLMTTIQAEYFPSHTRGKGAAITVIVTAIACFISIKSYQMIDDYFGMYMNYVIFAVISLIGSVIFSTVVHETAGKSLGQVQKSFQANRE